MRTKTIARRDLNEKPILAALRELGIWYRQQQPDAGFDILAAGRDGLRVIEIKNPDLPPSEQASDAERGYHRWRNWQWPGSTTRSARHWTMCWQTWATRSDDMSETLIGVNVRMSAELRAALQAWADDGGHHILAGRETDAEKRGRL